MYDVIVVGARVAGASTALLLARRGHRVLLVDRAGFPSDTLSSHFMHLSGAAHLHRWGLLDAVLATGCPPITSIRFDAGPLVLHGAPVPADDVSPMFCCRRTLLDALLVEAAAAAGAEVRQEFTVEDLVVEDGRVVGVRGRSRAGLQVTERAQVVVGADGRNSLVARLADAPVYPSATPALTCAYYSYWSGVDLPYAALYPRDGRSVAAMPTNDGLTCVYVTARRQEFHTFRHDLEANVAGTIALAPDLADRMAGARRVERIRGTADLPNFLRVPAGPGWALVGDAGCHKDPLLAHGMSDALRDADLLADALHDGLTHSGAMAASLARYAAARDAAETARFHLTLMLATLDPPPPAFAEFLASLVGDREGTGRFLGVLAGTVPVADVFGPLMAAA